MSVSELKATATKLTSEERLFLLAYLKHLDRVEAPWYQGELSRLHAEVDAGRRFSLDQVVRLHEALKMEGL